MSIIIPRFIICMFDMCWNLSKPFLALVISMLFDSKNSIHHTYRPGSPFVTWPMLSLSCPPFPVFWSKNRSRFSVSLRCSQFLFCKVSSQRRFVHYFLILLQRELLQRSGSSLSATKFLTCSPPLSSIWSSPLTGCPSSFWPSWLSPLSALSVKTRLCSVTLPLSSIKS